MGFRFRKSIGLIPGVKLNLSKSGPSVSVGGKGLTYNIGRKGSRTTIGLPGTGLSYSSYRPHGRKGSTLGGIAGGLILLAAIALFFTLTR